MFKYIIEGVKSIKSTIQTSSWKRREGYSNKKYVREILLQEIVENASNVRFLLHVAVLHQDLKSVKLLINHDTQLNALDQGELKDLLFIHNINSPDNDIKIKILSILLNHKSTSLYEQREDGETLMEYFLKYGGKRTREAVLKSNLDLSKVCGRNGETALHYLLQNKRLSGTPEEEIKLLLNRGFDVNMRNKTGLSALIWAVMNDFEEVAEFLMKNGAIVSWQDIFLNKNLISAFIHGYTDVQGHKKILEFILRQKLDTTIESMYEDLTNGSSLIPDNIFFAKIAVAHIAIAEVFGHKIDYFTSLRIESNVQLAECYGFCKAAIEKMSTVNLNSACTLFQLLIISNGEIDIYISNPDFVLKLRDLLSQKCYENLLYTVIIRKRIEYATKIKEQKKACG